MAKLSVTINNADKKQKSLKRLETMARALVKDGNISPSNRQILESEATKLVVSMEELNEIIRRVLGENSDKNKVEDASDPQKIDTKETSQNDTESKETSTVINPPPPPPPPEPEKEKDSKRKPLIIALSAVAVIIVALLAWLIRSKTDIPGNENAETNDTPSESSETVDPILDSLLKSADDMFNTKNVARAKKMLQDAMAQYPSNERLQNRVDKCNAIIKSSCYSSLKQVRGLSPIGEQDKLGYSNVNGYIVIDFLYDEEISRQEEMIALTKNGKYGVVGGDLKEPSDFRYDEALWIPSSKHYRLVKDYTGAADIVTVVEGKLTIQ